MSYTGLDDHKHWHFNPTSNFFPGQVSKHRTITAEQDAFFPPHESVCGLKKKRCSHFTSAQLGALLVLREAETQAMHPRTHWWSENNMGCQQHRFKSLVCPIQNKDLDLNFCVLNPKLLAVLGSVLVSPTGSFPSCKHPNICLCQLCTPMLRACTYLGALQSKSLL